MKPNLSYGEIKHLRKAKLSDSAFVLNLRNMKYVGEVSWNTDVIKKDNHNKFWKNNYQFYWIIQTPVDNISIGFVRVKNNEVSISILKEYWDQSYGYFALQEITNLFPGLRAEVKLDNNHSLYFFVKCGFVPVGFVLKFKEHGK